MLSLHFLVDALQISFDLLLLFFVLNELRNLARTPVVLKALIQGLRVVWNVVFKNRFVEIPWSFQSPKAFDHFSRWSWDNREIFKEGLVDEFSSLDYILKYISPWDFNKLLTKEAFCKALVCLVNYRNLP